MDQIRIRVRSIVRYIYTAGHEAASMELYSASLGDFDATIDR
jgi:hypothetical protein